MRGKQAGFFALIAMTVCAASIAASDPPATAACIAGLGCLAPGDGDVTDDGVVGLEDIHDWASCATGPTLGTLPLICCALDFESNATVDLADFASLQNVFGGCTPDRSLNRCSDDCADAVPLAGENAFAFNNATATLDGPEHTDCVFFMEGQIDRDVWGCWTSPCTSTVFVSACGLTDVDTKIAVYDGCDCPVSDARLLTCNEDACDLQSVVSFEATLGNDYLIRLGVFPDKPGGSGFIAVTCGLPECPAAGDCFAAHPSGGCDEVTCCESVCTRDPACCELEWDAICSDEAAGFCGSGFSACGPGAGSCTDVAGNDTPGCDDVDCCNAVCQADSYCCGAGGDGMWDELCADLQAAICFSNCGPGTGSCFDKVCVGGDNGGLPCEHDGDCPRGICGGNPSPGCELESCCAEVCPRDTFCCNGQWDASCADLARQLCTSSP